MCGSKARRVLRASCARLVQDACKTCFGHVLDACKTRASCTRLARPGRRQALRKRLADVLRGAGRVLQVSCHSAAKSSCAQPKSGRVQLDLAARGPADPRASARACDPDASNRHLVGHTRVLHAYRLASRRRSDTPRAGTGARKRTDGSSEKWCCRLGLRPRTVGRAPSA